MSALADRRRNLGPTDQIHFNIKGAENQEPPRTELRPVFLSQGIAAHATGSAYLEVGSLKLHATVYGPQQLRGTFSDQADIEVGVQIENFAGIDRKDDVSQGLSDFIRSSVTPAIILKEYPKSRIVINLAVIGGCAGAPLTANSVNAVTMALVNAGIAMHDMVTAVAVAKVSETEIYVDSDLDASTPNLKQLIAAYSVSTGKLVSMLVTSHGDVTKDDLRALMDRAKTATIQLRELFNSFLVEDYEKITKGAN